MNVPRESSPDLLSLVSLFYDSPDELATFTEVDAESLPLMFRRLLAHHEHMTVTVESFHGCPVDVDVLEAQRSDTHYARKILLRRQSDHRVVQFGIVRLNFDFLAEDVQREIEARQMPLGRILIEHNVLRQVQLASLWKLQPGAELRELFGLDKPVETYGRTALIYCNGEPAVELLEIVTPA